MRGRVVFGMPPTVGDVLATRLIERFLALHPEVTLRVVTAFSGYLLEWLHSGIVDIAVVYGSERMANLRVAPLLLETLHFVGGPGAAGPAARAVPFAEVAARRLVLPGPEHGLRILVEEEARRRGLALEPQRAQRPRHRARRRFVSPTAAAAGGREAQGQQQEQEQHSNTSHGEPSRAPHGIRRCTVGPLVRTARSGRWVS